MRAWISRKSLRNQLIIMFCLAMAPAAVLAVWQGLNAYNREIKRVETDLHESARLVGDYQANIILSARYILNTIANQPSIKRVNKENCASLLENAIVASRFYSNLLLLDPDGHVSCRNERIAEGTNFRDTPWFQAALQHQEFAVGVIDANINHGENAIVGAVPISDYLDQVNGVLLLKIKILSPETPPPHTLPDDLASVILDADGKILSPITPTSADHSKYPPQAFLETELKKHRTQFQYRGEDNVTRLFSIEPVIPDKIYILYGQPQKNLISPARKDLTRTIVTPLIIWGVGLLTLWFSVQRLVLQWVNYLGRIATIYGRGRYSVRPTRTEFAPGEFRDMGKTFIRMADVIQQREQELQSSLDQKNILLREVHHRVKNNLQIITSLLNLQARGLRNEKESAAFDAAKSRINALSLLHQNLYEAENLQYVNLQTYIEDLCQQLQRTGWSSVGDIRFDIDIPPVTVTADVATPLALLVTEIIINSFKHAFTGRDNGLIRIKLQPTGKDRAILFISDDGIGQAANDDEGSKGIGQTLIQAFAQQLDAEVQMSNDNGRSYTIIIPDFVTYS